jgi:hypothetical protein
MKQWDRKRSYICEHTIYDDSLSKNEKLMQL